VKEPANKHSGTIRWFDPQRRFGFVIPDLGKEDVFLYWRELRKAGISESDVKDGQRVEFTVKAPDKPGRCDWQVDYIKLLASKPAQNSSASSKDTAI